MELLFLILFCGGIMAGLVGSLTGLGGGVIVIPLLTTVLGFDMRYAIGTALITSIATSSGAAAAYIKERITNIRIGMLLEIATTSGAVFGALIAIYLDKKYIAVIFGSVLIFSAIRTVLKKETKRNDRTVSKLAEKLNLNGSYSAADGKNIEYKVKNIAGGFSIMTIAGALSGLLGIGSGAFKVLAMDTVMKIPFKVSTTTSNFMVGVTAAASAVVYLQRGYIDPGLAMPVVTGVLCGASFGSRILPKANTKKLRLLFGIMISSLAILMIYNGLTGNI